MFLFRKTQLLPLQELNIQEEKEPTRKKLIGSIMSALGQFGLKILERIMQRSKLSALKFHNVSNDWFHSIHERRQKGQQDERLNQHRRAEDKIKDAKNFLAPMPKPDLSAKFEPENVRPLVREAFVRPQPPVREKNQLEEALIKRIAVNPRDIEAYERLGDYYLESGSYRDSHECFKQVLRLSPAHYKAKIRIRKLEGLLK
jgi:tetratricopeptide (TPR) repeat protein